MGNSEFGKKEWAFSVGMVPLKSTGKEPDFVSSDRLAILNASKENATVKMIICFADREPAGEYEVEVGAERVRNFRINDLIDPHAIPLGVEYGCYLKSNVPVVVQFGKQHTAADALAIMGTMAYGESLKDR